MHRTIATGLMCLASAATVRAQQGGGINVFMSKTNFKPAKVDATPSALLR